MRAGAEGAADGAADGSNRTEGQVRSNSGIPSHNTDQGTVHKRQELPGKTARIERVFQAQNRSEHDFSQIDEVE